MSGGRAEITLGRGSFTESFPLFGFDMADYERLFAEKLDLWAALQGEGSVSWSNGTLRPPLTDARVFPRTERGHMPTWIGVGGSPESVVRAARYGFPLMLAIIGGDPARFAPYADLYRRALTELEQPDLPIGVHSPGFVADTDTDAREPAVPALQGQSRPDRRRARLGPGHPRAVRRGGRAGLALRRLPGDRRAQDRRHRAGPGHPALRPEVQQRLDAAPAADAQHRVSTAPR
ncbi:LLM class flavin-dependent oxidoreductase [Nocardioides convexus]|uniref:LLM class flavin-dependent oxidoreductase n=1 Tax=Nocardioides convexus TaxID=2712224 RepID=UPI0024186E6B|nr:LLM class flavin-dependent oxidoreductase [Nocardioides convexus]